MDGRRRLRRLGIRRITICALAAALTAALFLDDGGRSQAAAKAFDAAALDAGVIRRTNAYRKDKGLKALKQDAKLERAAQDYADYYAANPGRPVLWGHEYGGLDPMDRAENAGFEGRCVGENLGWQGTSGALSSLGAIDKKMVDGWIESRPHRKNLEFRQFDLIGVGSAQFRAEGMQWIVTVQMFGCSEKLNGASRSFRFGR